MKHIAEMNDEQLERRVAKLNRRSERQELQRLLYRYLESRTPWGKMSRIAQLKAGAKLLAGRISAKGETMAVIGRLREVLP